MDNGTQPVGGEPMPWRWSPDQYDHREDLDFSVCPPGQLDQPSGSCLLAEEPEEVPYLMLAENQAEMKQVGEATTWRPELETMAQEHGMRLPINPTH
jgi:hypothetical protein